MINMALSIVTIGNKTVCIEDEEFVRGFETGYDAYRMYHRRDDEVICTHTFLFLLKNGWNAGQSDQWITGYITGWYAAFHEQEHGQLALSVEVNGTDGEGAAEQDSEYS
jgi:hypothetical protein